MEGEYPTFVEMEARLAEAEAQLEARRRAPAIQPAPEIPGTESPSAGTQEATPGNEAKLVQALRAGRVLAFEWDVVSDRVTRSENTEEIFGLPGILMATGATFFEMVHPEDRARILQLLSTLCERGGCYCEQFRLLRPDGTILWMEESARGEFDPSGNLILLRGLRADITKRKRAEEKLEEAKRLLDAFMEYVPEGITIADGPEAKIRMVSRQGWEILGGPREGMPVEKLIAKWKTYGSDGTTLLVNTDLPLTRALQKGETVRNEELVLVNAKGRRVTLSCNAAPIRSHTGDILGGIAAWRDISELKIAVEALHASDRRLAETLASISDAFVSFDSDWRYTYVNDQAERILRKRREEMLGRTFWEVFPESAESEFDREFRRAVAERRTVSFEAYFAPLETWYECNCYPSRGGMSVYFRDVNERKRAAAVLEQTHNELEQKVALRALTLQLTQTEERERRRLAQVLHDHLQQLLVDARDSLAAVRSSREATKLELVRETMKRVDKFLGDAIDTSRSLTQELSPPVLSQGSLAEAIKWLGRQFRENYHLSVRLSGDRNAHIEDEQFRVAIFHALRELLLNVVKHAKVKIARVHLALSKDGPLQIVVSDKGVGFDPARVLVREGAQGGFGLFSLKELMELLGGGLEMDSEPGRGSRIILSAPLRQPAAGSASGSEPAAASRPRSNPRR